MTWINETIIDEAFAQLVNMTLYLDETEEKLLTWPLHEDPPVTGEEVAKKFEKLMKKVERIMKMKPPVKPSKIPDPYSAEFMEEMFKKQDLDIEIEGMTKEQIKEIGSKLSPSFMRDL